MPHTVSSLYVFVCHRSRHAGVVEPWQRFVVCPECGSAGETVEVRMGVEWR